MNRRLGLGGTMLALITALLCGEARLATAATIRPAADTASTPATAPAALTTPTAAPSAAGPAATPMGESPAARSLAAAAAGEDPLPFLQDRGDKTALPEVPEMSTTIVKMIATMVLIVAALLGGAWLFNRFARQRLAVGVGERPLRLVGRVALGPRKSACVLSVGGRYLLLGIGEREVNLLLEMDLPADSENTDFTKLLTQVKAGDTTPTAKT